MPSILWNPPMAQLQWGAVIGASLVAAGWDVKSRRIPNVLTGLLLLGGFAAAGGLAGWAGVRDAAGGCLLLGVPYVLLFVFAGGGAGDAKMMAALGAWLGFSNAVVALVAVSAAGAVMGVIYAARQRRVRSVLGNLVSIGLGTSMLVMGGARLREAHRAFPDEQRMLPMPYGLAILAGMCIACGVRMLWHS